MSSANNGLTTAPDLMLSQPDILRFLAYLIFMGFLHLRISSFGEQPGFGGVASDLFTASLAIVGLPAVLTSGINHGEGCFAMGLCRGGCSVGALLFLGLATTGFGLLNVGRCILTYFSVIATLCAVADLL
jgi:hypothetical protein